jgi:hypothetical protein
VFISRKWKVGCSSVEGVAGDEELDRAGALVADGRGGAHRGVAHPCAQALVDGGGRALLDDLLVPALDRALALEQVHDVAVLVAEDLDLHVPGSADQPFEDDPVVTERGAASRRAAASASGSAARSATARMPLPPPPATALTSSGNPTSPAAASSARRRGPRRRCRARPGRPPRPVAAWRPPCRPSAGSPPVRGRRT